MGSVTLLAVALAIAPPMGSYANNGGAYGWQCAATVHIPDFEGNVSRFYRQGAENQEYRLQLRRVDHGRRRDMSWTIDPRPLAEAETRPFEPRPLSTVFRTGPDYVHIDFDWHTSATGPIWAYYWGDGRYAGADMLVTKRDARRFTGRDNILVGLSAGLATRSLLAALADARSWTVVAADSTGKRIFSETFEMPDRQLVEAQFLAAKSQIDQLEPEFSRTHQGVIAGDVSCADDVNPDSSI